MIVLAIVRWLYRRKNGLKRMEEYLAWRERLDQRIAIRDRRVWNLMAAGAIRHFWKTGRIESGTPVTDELIHEFPLPPDVPHPQDYVLVLDLTPAQAFHLFGVEGVSADGISEPNHDRLRPQGTCYWVHRDLVRYTVETLCLVAQEPTLLSANMRSFRQIHGAVFVGQADAPGFDLFIHRLGPRRYQILNFSAPGSRLTVRVPRLDPRDLQA